MLDLGGINPSAPRQYSFYLFFVEGNLIEIKNRLKSAGVPIGQSVDQAVVFECVRNNNNCVLGADFLILDPHGIDGDNRSLGTKSVATRPPHFNLAGKPLAFHFFFQGFFHGGRSIGPTAGHADVHNRSCGFRTSKNFIAEPFQLADGL